MVLAEIFLSAFIEVVVEKLVSLVSIGFARREGILPTVTKWENLLEHIQRVLGDAEEKQITDKNVKKWLDDLRDLAYDVDDILDEFCTRAPGHKISGEPESSRVSKVRRLIPTCWTSSFSPSAFMSNRRIESELNEMTSRLEDISKRRTDLGLVTIPGETPTKLGGRRPSTSLVDESHVYGRDKDRDAIIELLKTNAPTDDNYGVISIVGLGGLGKTTLAQLVYNDDTVKQHFDLKAWTCVSDTFDVMGTTKAILEASTSQTSDCKEFNQVQNKLKEALTGKRFLIVLDDVWNKKPSDWDALQIPFIAGKPGSKVIVTTRESQVALMMGPNEYKLELLSKLECWSVFERHAFWNRNVNPNPRLREIGDKIVDKCRGLPLAVKTLAGLLRHTQREDAWKAILNSKIWDLPDGQSDILPALRLSYHHLPRHLKPCFAYLSILPKDYEFEEEEIVLLWMAEGFLQQAKEEKQMEDLGGEYFRDLLSRSFFQHSSSDTSRYVMHDLINDLAQWVAGEVCFKLEDKLDTPKQRESFKKARHSSYIAKEYDGMKKFEIFHEVKCLRLRTFMPFHLQSFYRGECYLTKSVLVDLLPKLRCLRVLSLSGYCITELPDSIGDLKHLRYLDLSFTQIQILPESVTTLYNLQTLLLTKCFHLERLPTAIGDLQYLRYLDLSSTDIKILPESVTTLYNLQTLLLKKCLCLERLPTAIGDLKHLRYLDFSSTHIKILPESVTTLYNLQTLLLKKCSHLERLPTGIRNLTHLRHLDITGVDLLEMPPQMGMLTNLQTLSDFIVGRGCGSGIQELRNLLHLRKKLSISKLENVTEAQEAQKAKLNEWTKLDVLEMGWSSDLDDNSQTVRVARIDVLEMLQPPKELKELSIRGYDGTAFPTWIRSPPFSDMVLLRLENCVKCKSLPPLGELPSLKDLFIRRMNGVNSIGPEFFGKDLFPSLKTLRFEDMQEWESWSPPDINRQVKFFSLLHELSIKNCPKLLGRLPAHLPSLEKLVIYNCKILAVSVSSLPNICKLHIMECEEVVQGNTINDLSSLKPMSLYDVSGLECLTEDLTIRGYSGIACLWQKEVGLLQHLTSLCHLKIESCPNFTMLVAEKEEEVKQHQQGLPCKLESLELRSCYHLEKLQGLPTMLRKLTIAFCSRLVSFPKIGLPPMLREIAILGCDFESLPFTITLCSNSTSLEYLSISQCPSLTFIARGQLSSTLKRLHIESCDNLTSLLVEEEEEGRSLEKSNDSSTSLLEELTIRWCKSLKSLSSRGELPIKNLHISYCSKLESIAESLHNNTYLEELTISKCESLKSLSSRGELPITLKKLYIKNCFKLESIAESLHNNTCLEDITIGECRSLKALLEGLHNLNHLSTISIEGWPSFRFYPDAELLPLGIHNLTSLRELKMKNFSASKVSSFPQEPFPPNLTSLVIHRIKNCKPLFEWELRVLTSLKRLCICGVWPDLVSFPGEKGMILPASLTALEIGEFPNLKYLSSNGFHYLTSLEYLEICECPKLKSFPEKGFPPSLLRLFIRSCSLLEQLCRKDKEIAKIPCIEIH